MLKIFLLDQVGPYTFREEHEKTNITFKPDHTVQYMQKKFWYFDAGKSSGSLDDEIYTLNMVAVAASDATRYPGNKCSPFSLSFLICNIYNRSQR